MPLYEYQCDACGQRFEKIRKFSDPPLDACPSCGGTVQKLMSAPAFQLKGTGWYITDYAKKDSGVSTGSSSSKDDKPGKADDSSTKASDKTPGAGESTPAASSPTTSSASKPTGDVKPS
jgi:putative FmdB family regulatory protein